MSSNNVKIEKHCEKRSSKKAGKSSKKDEMKKKRFPVTVMYYNYTLVEAVPHPS